MMNCRLAEKLVQQGADGPLSRAERERLDQHLECCADCRLAWHEYRRLREASEAWKDRALVSADPGDAFTEQVLAQIAARSVAPSSTPLFRLPRFALVSASMAFLTGLSSVFGPYLPGLASLRLVNPAWSGPVGLTGSLSPAWATLSEEVHLPAIVSAHLWAALVAALAVNGALAWQASRAPSGAAAQ